MKYKNDEAIEQAVGMYEVMTAELLAMVTEVGVGTIRNVLTRVVKRKQIKCDRRWHGESLYRAKGTRRIEQVSHTLSTVESMAALAVGVRNYNGVHGWGQDPDFFELTDMRSLEIYGQKIIPDESFVIHDGERNMFGFWEEDRGTIRSKKPDKNYEQRFRTYWMIREAIRTGNMNEQLRALVEKWGMRTFRVFMIAGREKDLPRLKKQGERAHPDYNENRGSPVSDMFYFSSRERWRIKDEDGKLLLSAEEMAKKLTKEPIWVTAVDDRPRSMLRE